MPSIHQSTDCDANTTTFRHISKYKHSLTFCVQCYVVIATKPMHRLQIHPIVHN